MKQRFRIIVIFVVALLTTSPAFARGNANGNNKERVSREELARTQANYIARELAFDEPTTKKFIDTYCQCQSEIWALGERPRPNRGSKVNGEERPRMTVAERLDRSQKILDIRKKYYGEYSKFLTDTQIDRVYQLERKMMDKLSKRRSTDKKNRHYNKRK